MAKIGHLIRYSAIIEKIRRNKFITMKELQKFVEEELESNKIIDNKIAPGDSKRTLERDIKEIRNIIGIEITYSKKMKGYYIDDENSYATKLQNLLDEAVLFHNLKTMDNVKAFVDIEVKRSKGLNNIHGIIHAIKNQIIIKFTYNHFYLDEFQNIVGEPYAVKEFKNRWYLIIKEKHENFYTTFGLDRITDFEITNQKFQKKADFDIKEAFRNNYGIMTYWGEKPVEIVLQFEPLQGKYVKSLPLHHSQQVLVDMPNELQISLYLIPTFDFRMELLSYGNSVKVLKPESLKNELIEIYKKALEQYN